MEFEFIERQTLSGTSTLEYLSKNKNEDKQNKNSM